MACPEERRVGPSRASHGVSFSSLWHRLACRRQASARAPPVSYGVRRPDAALPFLGAGLQTRPRDACVAISALVSAGPDHGLPAAPSFALSAKGRDFSSLHSKNLGILKNSLPNLLTCDISIA